MLFLPFASNLCYNNFDKKNRKRGTHHLCGTPNHPVFSKIDNCYKDLKDIKENEIVKLNDKQYECQNLTGVQNVYNIEVANTHNYYANGILVHNCNIKDRASHAERERIKSVWMELKELSSE